MQTYTDCFSNSHNPVVRRPGVSPPAAGQGSDPWDHPHPQLLSWPVSISVCICGK